MPSQTADNLIPYPVDSDPVADLATAVQALAERVDKLTPLTGKVTVPVTAANNGSIAVAFPVGKFDGAPRVLTTIESGSSAYSSYVNGITTTGATIRVRHNDGTSQTTAVDVQWCALDVDE